MTTQAKHREIKMEYELFKDESYGGGILEA